MLDDTMRMQSAKSRLRNYSTVTFNKYTAKNKKLRRLKIYLLEAYSELPSAGMSRISFKIIWKGSRQTYIVKAKYPGGSSHYSLSWCLQSSKIKGTAIYLNSTLKAVYE